MSQRVGRIQQENAKLREEIKKLKGALKNVSHDSCEELPLKALKAKSPISKDRKKELRDEIDNRLNYMMPNKELLKGRTKDVKNDGVETSKLKKNNEFEVRDEGKANFKNFVNIGKGKKGDLEESEELLEASFAHDDELLVEIPKQALKDGKAERLRSDEQSCKVEVTLSPRSVGSLEDDYLKAPSLFGKIEDSPEFSVRSPEAVQIINPQGLKDSFSSFYNDESLNKTLQDKSFNESLIKPQLINQTQLVENSSTLKKTLQNKYPGSILKNSSSFRSILSSQSYPEKTLLNEIEALRQENMKLRLQINKNPKSSQVNLGTLRRFKSRNNLNMRKKSKSLSKSKSQSRKCKSRSITPRNLSTRRLKRNISNNTLVGDSSLTPKRYRHCKTCDHLLCKGYSTKYCGKHGNAKLP